MVDGSRESCDGRWPRDQRAGRTRGSLPFLCRAKLTVPFALAGEIGCRPP